MSTNYLYAQSEVVRKKLMPKFFSSKWSVATDLIESKGEMQKIGERDFRIPFETHLAGRYGIYDPNLGDMGRGSAMKGSYMTGSYVHRRLNFELDFLSHKVTKNPEVSLKKPFNEMVAQGMQTLARYMDAEFHGSGTGFMATATAVAVTGGVTVYTLDTSFGPNKLVRGQYVTPFASDTTTAKTIAYIDKIDYANRKITLSANITGASGDLIAVDGGTNGTTPVGYRGLYYWNNTATSGTTAGVDRAVEQEMWANSVTAASGLTFEHGLLGLDKLFLRRREMPADLTGLINVAQRAAILSDNMSLQNMQVSGSSAAYMDRLPKGFRDPAKSFDWCGVPHIIDVNQDQTRVDWISPKAWGRAVLDAPQFFEIPGSNQRFFDIKGSSGAPAAGVWFGLVADVDYYNTNPGTGVVFASLPLPTLYQ